MKDKTFTPLPRDFYLPDAVTVAKNLLGCILVHETSEGRAAGIVVETEAYAGRDDAACHSHKRAAPSGDHRTNIMFSPGGHAYVYLIYGMYNCFNVVASPEGDPQAVLIRALEPTLGLDLMAARRKTTEPKKLCSGPGKLCIAMGITREHYGVDLCESKNLFIASGETMDDKKILATPRNNVDYAGEASLLPYRFVIGGSKFLSTRRFIGR